MKICWDNIESAKLSKGGDFIIKRHRYVEKERCVQCGESYLMLKYKPTDTCSTCCGNIGRIMPESVRIRISKKLSVLRSGRGNTMYGKTLSVTHRRRISNSCSGLNTGTKNGMYGRCGVLSPVWCGGTSFEPYCYEWSFKEFKDLIKKRDGDVCLNPDCRHNSKRLAIHHIDYNKKNCSPGNLITLCNSCNGRANGNRKWHKAWYQAIMYNRYGGK